MELATRIIFSLLLFILAVLSPGVVFIFLGFLGVLIFGNYFEFIIFAMFADILYGAPIDSLSGFRYIFLAVAFFIFIVGKLIRGKVRFFETA